MTTINTTSPASNNNGGTIIGIFAIIVFGLLFFYYGIPALRTLGTPQVNTPSVINVPDKVDVNVQQTP